MWTCHKCGEVIEYQFDSCWKCADKVEPSTSLSVPPRARWHDYASALLVSYLIPCIAVLLDAVFAPQYWTHSTISSRDLPGAFLWMLVPAIITFFAIWPFRLYPIGRRIAAACACIGWMCLFSMTHVRVGLA